MREKVSVELDPGVILEVTRRGGADEGLDFTSGYPADVWLQEYGPQSRENLENLMLKAERLEDENAQVIFTSITAPIFTIFAILTTLILFAVQGVQAGSSTYPIEASVKELSLSVHSIAFCLSNPDKCPRVLEDLVTAQVEPRNYLDEVADWYVQVAPMLVLLMVGWIGISTIYSARKRDRRMRYARAWKRYFEVRLESILKGA